MAIPARQKRQQEYEAMLPAHWERMHKLIPSNVRLLFWVIFIWCVLVHGDLLRHMWSFVGPFIMWSGITNGPFNADYLTTIKGLTDL